MTVQDARSSGDKTGNVIVAVRVRPASTAEGKYENILEVVEPSLVRFDPVQRQDSWGDGPSESLSIGARRKRNATYAFDHVFGPTSSQRAVYESTGMLVIDDVLSGYNATVFAYGATGAGKTCTMIGNKSIGPGVMVLTMTDIFNRMKERENAYQFRITISYLEVYNETIRDLLVEKSRPLPLREDPRRGTTVAQLTTYNPESASEVFDLLERGNARRSQSPTDANSESSRSHAVLQIFVEAQ
eukprot:688351_1